MEEMDVQERPPVVAPIAFNDVYAVLETPDAVLEYTLSVRQRPPSTTQRHHTT